MSHVLAWNSDPTISTGYYWDDDFIHNPTDGLTSTVLCLSDDDVVVIDTVRIILNKLITISARVFRFNVFLINLLI